MTMCSAESTAADHPGMIGGGSGGSGGGGGGGGGGGSIIVKTPDTTNRNPNRRSNKPIMEKRRRARINNCLNELKAILLEAMRKDPARHSKLEKADILELTVSHLKALHRQHGGNVNGTLHNDGSKFRAGFSECAAEVSRFLSAAATAGNCKTQKNCEITSALDQVTSARLLGHLADCLNNPMMMAMTTTSSSTTGGAGGGEGQGSGGDDHYTNNMHHHHHHHSTLSVVPPNTPVISLVPSRLSSGEIAFVVPAALTSRASSSSGSMSLHHPHNSVTTTMTTGNGSSFLSPEVPLELTVPSSSSSSSSSSLSSGCSLSPGNYSGGHHGHHHGQQNGHYGPFLHRHHNQHHHHHHPFSPSQQPLALVTPKKESIDGLDPSCWRPWW